MRPTDGAPAGVAEKGSARGQLSSALPTWTQRDDHITVLFLNGLQISAWGWREDLLAIPCGATVTVPWKRLHGREALYLDGTVTVEPEPR